MREMRLRTPGGLDRLELGTAEPEQVRAGQVRVRLHASSLNYHDYMVVTGGIPTPDGRIPMSDGAGEVVEVGEGVSELAVGDRVVSTFFPRWLGGELTPEGTDATTYLSGSCHNLPIIDVCPTTSFDRPAERIP
jgi:NADPH:quinone reductase-like Zn-dependent oxidoreductase